MEKFIQFVSAADDAATLRMKNFVNMSLQADGVLIMRFCPSSKGMSDFIDKITLTITSDAEQEVMDAIAKELALGKDQIVLIADDVASNYFHPDILSCVIDLDI